MATRDLPSSLVLPSPLDSTARRIEIDEFIADEAMTNLFLLALEDMRVIRLKKASDPEEDWFSFYNLAAIHGFPFEQWRGVKNQAPQNVKSGFYCTHGSTVFPTWHRLYIHMFEPKQAMFRRMTKIASQFTRDDLKEAHTKALSRFRLPYWDPCLPRNQLEKGDPDIPHMWDMPLLLKAQFVHVITPDGVEKQIPNPLLNSNFPTPAQYEETGRAKIDWKNESGLSQIIENIKPTGYAVTLRTPTEEGVPSDELFKQTIQRQYAQLSVDLFQLIHPDLANDKRPWDIFANHWEVEAEKKRWPMNTSLESWHDNIHVLVGAGNSAGHMTVVPVAAFDPIFWLHHNNIDRIFALYQALYGHLDNRFVADVAVGPNAVQADSNLAPFVKLQNETTQEYYNSNDVKDWRGLGYAVPGDKYLDEAGRDALARYIVKVYRWSSDQRTRPEDTLGYPREVSHHYALSGRDFDLEAAKPVEFLSLESAEIKRQVYASSGDQLKNEPLDIPFNISVPDLEQYPKGSFIDREKGEMRTWTVLMRVKKYAFRKSFSVELFIGGRDLPSSDGALLLLAPNTAGFSSVFAFDPKSDCDNCRENSGMIYGDTISITAELREYLVSNTAERSPQGVEWPPRELKTLESFEAEHVVPFLKENLEWRIVMPDGRVASEEEVRGSGLELLVTDSVYTYPTEGNGVGVLGRYGERREWPEVTRGKVGGYVD